MFGLVEILLRCTLTMNNFQDLMMQTEGYVVLLWSASTYLPAPSSNPENDSHGESTSQDNSNKLKHA
ncbi:hypothetical protein EVAR_50792_1 [Eumeta japonica]|uniref:Uncharacterized protein n=1 Tax=Eumeta variegata TaxID=151549 RepID=A0A4C1XGT9_EUMVA|nr:hypothetical protein EVAR_50792_1 [Eumeta japonica]